MQFELINPPIELRTNDPLITINSRSGYATLHLHRAQKKRFKSKAKLAAHVDNILKDTAEIFGQTK